MLNDQKKKKNFNIGNQNPAEVVKDTVVSVAKTTTDEIGQIGSKAMEQILGTGQKTVSGEIKLGQTVEMKANDEEMQVVATPNRIETRELYNREEIKTNQEIQMLLKNLKEEVIRLQETSDSMAKEATVVTIKGVVSPGKYHINFLKWLITSIRDLRKKVGESRTWLNTFMAKKNKKNFWDMSSKHGSSFSQSFERTSDRRG